jgi:hypothetical protein
MKTFLKIIAWLGLVIMAAGITYSLSWSALHNHYPGASFINLFLISGDVIGLPLMLIGGLIAKPRYFWLASIIVGVLHILPYLIPWFVIQHLNITDAWGLLLTFVLSPGLLAIIIGVILKIIEKRRG